MTPGGWIIMLVSTGGVTALFLWCLWKVFTLPDETEKIHGFEFETPDEKISGPPKESGTSDSETGSRPN